jgi:hypothetical protein
MPESVPVIKTIFKEAGSYQLLSAVKNPYGMSFGWDTVFLC